MCLVHFARVCMNDLHAQGYILKITGGQDKQGFAMKQGVLTNGRVRLLMAPGDQGFRGYGRRNGEHVVQCTMRDGLSGHALRCRPAAAQTKASKPLHATCMARCT
jgi:hypothetical protein